MRKVLSTLMAAALFALVPVYASEPVDTQRSVAVEDIAEYAVYPKNAQGIMHTNQVKNPPKSIFTNPERAVGVRGHVYKFCGDVISKEDNGKCNEIVMQTEDGNIKILDLYSMLVKDNLIVATDELNERFSFPDVGEQACIYAEYDGFKKDFDSIVAYLGSKVTVSRSVSKPVQDINSVIYGLDPPAIENDLDGLPHNEIAKSLNQSMKNNDVINGHEIVYKYGIIYVNIWKSGFASSYDSGQRDTYRSDFISYADHAKAQAVELAGNNRPVVVANVLDERTNGRILLNIINSKIVYEARKNVNDESNGTSRTYVLNTSTKKFHYPSCSDVDKIAPKNYSTFSGTHSQAVAKGYSPCKHCNP